MLAMIAFASTVGLSSCYHWGKRVRGNGQVSADNRNVTTFKDVAVSGQINVYISEGSQPSVKIEGDENLLPYIEVTQDGDRLWIGNKQGFDLQPRAELKIYVTAPAFHELETSGVCDIIGQGKIAGTDEMDLHCSGVGDIKMDVDAPHIRADVSGTGGIHLKGQTKDLDMTLSGVGNAHCFDLLSENANVEVSGVGSADVYASTKIEARVSGAGSIHYKGNPGNVSQQVSGVGSISKVN